MKINITTVIAIVVFLPKMLLAENTPYGIFPTKTEFGLRGHPKTIEYTSIGNGGSIMTGTCRFDENGYMVFTHQCFGSSVKAIEYIYKRGVPVETLVYHDAPYDKRRATSEKVVAYHTDGSAAKILVHGIGIRWGDFDSNNINDPEIGIVTIDYRRNSQLQTSYTRRAGKFSVLGSDLYEFDESNNLVMSCHVVGVNAIDSCTSLSVNRDKPLNSVTKYRHGMPIELISGLNKVTYDYEGGVITLEERSVIDYKSTPTTGTYKFKFVDYEFDACLNWVKRRAFSGDTDTKESSTTEIRSITYHNPCHAK